MTRKDKICNFNKEKNRAYKLDESARIIIESKMGWWILIRHFYFLHESKNGGPG